MQNNPDHHLSLAIGIITCKRPKGLRTLLEGLCKQSIPSGCKAKIVIVNNDLESHDTVRALVEAIEPHSQLKIALHLEPTRGISQARNKLIAITAQEDALIFIDDDEYPCENWLACLVATWKQTGADIVTGPVQGVLPADAPAWALRSRTYNDYRNHQTGTDVQKAYTNNTLVSGQVLRALQPAFDPAFSLTGSEDIHYFQRALRAGFKIVWCAEAIVFETVPHSRLSLWWLTKRSFRNGAGDAIVRLRLNRGFMSYGRVFLMGCGRIVYGLQHIGIGIFRANYFYSVRGYRLLISGIGTYAGIFGLNYQEYKRIHGE
jgi:GT2 family glycosyltransferase